MTSSLIPATSTCVEVNELILAVAEAFDSVVGADALMEDSSLKGRLTLRMKRSLVIRAVERFIRSSSSGTTVEDVVDVAMNESRRLNCLRN